MILFFDKKKFTIFCLFILFLTGKVGGYVSAGNMEEETVKIDEYTIELSPTAPFETRERISDAKVDCGCFSGTLEKKISADFGMSIEDTNLKALLTACGLDLNLGSEQLKVTAKIELRNEILKKTTRFASKKLSIVLTKKIPLEDLRCYNQYAVIISDVEKYTAKTKRKRTFWSDEEFQFEWEEKTNHRLLIVAEYDEECHRRCEIKGKKQPVLDKDGEQMYVKIPYQKKREYIIPLYWGENGEIIHPFELLPEETKKEIKMEFIDGL